MSTHLGLPPFHHHRADDDAAICGQIFAAMIPMLKELGVERVSQINGALAGKKRGGRGRRSANHLILLAKNQTGLRNLYKLVSLSHREQIGRASCREIV